MLSSHLPILFNPHLHAEPEYAFGRTVLQAYFPCHLVSRCWAGDAIWQMYLVNWTTLVVSALAWLYVTLPSGNASQIPACHRHVLACNMQGFGMFTMHVCMLCACNMHTTCSDMHVSLNMHGSCMQHAHYMQEISTRAGMLGSAICRRDTSMYVYQASLRGCGPCDCYKPFPLLYC